MGAGEQIAELKARINELQIINRELESDWAAVCEANIRMMLYMKSKEREFPSTFKLRKLFPLDHYEDVRPTKDLTEVRRVV